MLTACRSKKDRKDSQQALSRIIIAREGHGLTLVGAPAATEFATSIILDRCCARRPAGRQAGTKKRPLVSRTKKHDEVGSTGVPSKGVSLLPMMNSEEAKKRTLACYSVMPHIPSIFFIRILYLQFLGSGRIMLRGLLLGSLSFALPVSRPVPVFSFIYLSRSRSYL
jgi:hypothetical protein